MRMVIYLQILAIQELVEIIGEHQCRFQCNGTTTDQIFSIRQILEKKWEYKEIEHKLFVDLKKAYDSVRRKVLYNILIEFGVPMKLFRLIKMCLNETYSKVHTRNHLSHISYTKWSKRRRCFISTGF
jgi:hypothetical protein